MALKFSSTRRTRTRLASTLAMAAVAALPFAAQASYSEIIAFGDSLSDNGNVYSAIRLPAGPYDQRFSNGPVAVEVMASALGVGLRDFAYGGALVGEDNRAFEGVPELGNTGLQSQIADYLDDLGDAGQTADASALYFMWGGGNDFLGASTPELPATADYVVSTLSSHVTQLHGAGAREFFVVGQADLAYTADNAAADPATQEAAHQFTLAYNDALAGAMTQLQGSLEGATIHLFNPNATLVSLREQLLAQGGELGTPCWDGDYLGQGTQCANPDQYFLWDEVHPTAVVHTAVGQAMAAAVPEPTVTGLALVGLLVAGMAARRSAKRSSRSAQCKSQA